VTAASIAGGSTAGETALAIARIAAEFRCQRGVAGGADARVEHYRHAGLLDDHLDVARVVVPRPRFGSRP
jgi:hypothetical protein